jgi:hypothetical protein
MSNHLLYLINVSICITAFYLFYYVFLRKVTLFTTIRIYLLFSLLFAFIIPALQVQFFHFTAVNSEQGLKTFVIANYIPEESFNTDIPQKHILIANILWFIYFGGVLFMLGRLTFFIIRIVKLVRINEVIKIEQNNFVLMHKRLSPFSFFHYIFIDRITLSKVPCQEPSIEHEKIHAKELHSLDLLTAELVTALLWFNPFVFFFRNSIKANHEYLADAKAIKSGIHPLDYITNLANEVFTNNMIGLTSNFNCLTLKKRLIMITKIKSSKKATLKLLFLLPIICVLIVAFASPNNVKSELPAFSNTSNISKISEIPSITPIKKAQFQETSGYGWRIHPIYKKRQFHNGVDFKAEEGTSVIATADGIVQKCEFIEQGKGYGRMILIQHNQQYSTLYAQLSEFKVKVGDQVKQGSIIGLVGHSGISTGPHLHYEVFKDGKNVDPKEYIK